MLKLFLITRSRLQASRPRLRPRLRLWFSVRF